MNSKSPVNGFVQTCHQNYTLYCISMPYFFHTQIFLCLTVDMAEKFAELLFHFTIDKSYSYVDDRQRLKASMLHGRL